MFHDSQVSPNWPEDGFFVETLAVWPSVWESAYPLCQETKIQKLLETLSKTAATENLPWICLCLSHLHLPMSSPERHLEWTGLWHPLQAARFHRMHLYIHDPPWQPALCMPWKH